MAHPSDPSAAAQVFVAAYRAAAAAAAERQRLQQESRQRAEQMQVEREKLAATQAAEQQRIASSARESEARMAMQNQYHQQQAALKQQQLEQQQQKAQQTAQMAYQRYQESQREKEMTRQFQMEQQKRTQEAAMEREKYGWEQRKALADAARKSKGQMTEYQRDRQIDTLEKRLDKLNENNPNLYREQPGKDWSESKTAMWRAARAEKSSIEQEIKTLKEGGSLTAPTPAAAPAGGSGAPEAPAAGGFQKGDDGVWRYSAPTAAPRAAPAAAGGVSFDEQGRMTGLGQPILGTSGTASAPAGIQGFSADVLPKATAAPAAALGTPVNAGALPMKPQPDWQAMNAAQDEASKRLLSNVWSGVKSLAGTIFDTGSDIYKQPVDVTKERPVWPYQEDDGAPKKTDEEEEVPTD